MSYNLFLLGIAVSIFSAAVLVAIFANRVADQPIHGFWTAYWAVLLAGGAGLILAGTYLISDVYYVDQLVVLGLVTLLILYTAATNEKGADIVKSSTFLILLLFSILLFAAPQLLDRLTEIGTGGLKFAALERTDYSAIEREKSFKPTRLLRKLVRKEKPDAFENVVQQDAAMGRIEGYKLSAALSPYMEREMPSEAQKRKAWAESLYRRATQGEIGADVETVRRHLEAWTLVWEYEEFAKFFREKVRPILEEARERDEQGERRKAEDAVTRVLTLLEGSDGRRFAEGVYYHSYILAFLHLFRSDTDEAFRAAYDGAARFRRHINANETLRFLLWTQNNDSLTAKQYSETALASELAAPEKIKEGYDSALRWLGTALQQSSGKQKPILEAEIATVEKHRATYENKLIERFRAAATGAKNDVAYFAALERVDGEKARTYAEQAVDEDPDASNLDTLGFVTLRFAEPGERGRDQIREAIVLFERAKRLVVSREGDLEARKAFLKVIALHRREALNRLAQEPKKKDAERGAQR
jgi:hypothetical protein